MARTVVEAQITTPNARSKLRGNGPHWRQIAPGVHLGYRRAKRGGSWLARWYLGNGKYSQKTLGVANDDGVKADGVHVLDFAQAEHGAREAATSGYQEANALADGGIKTVRLAIEEYSLVRDAVARRLQGRDGIKSDFTRRMAMHVLASKLADKPLHSLTVDDLKAWVRSLPATLAAGSVRRTRNDLKAALNDAGRAWHQHIPDSYLTTVKNGLSLKNVARKVPVKVSNDDFADVETQIIKEDDVRRIVAAAAEIDAENGWNGDLHRMVALLAVTGLRLSQLSRCLVADVDADLATISVPPSRKGRGETEDAAKIHRRIAPTVVDLLRPILNRTRRAILLETAEWKKEGYGWADTGAKRPWRSTDIARPWKLIRARADVGMHLTPYCLRHSSIVRLIMRNVPTLIVAKLHNTSVEMIEKHYSKAITRAHVEAENDILLL